MSEKNKNKSSINLSQIAQPKIKDQAEFTDNPDRNYSPSQNFVQNKRVTAVALSLITCLLICAVGFQVTHSTNNDVALNGHNEKNGVELQNYSNEKIALQEKIDHYRRESEGQANHIIAMNQKLDKTIERLNATHATRLDLENTLVNLQALQEKQYQVQVAQQYEQKPLRKISISAKVREMREKLLASLEELEEQKRANEITRLRADYLEEKVNALEQNLYAKDNENNVQIVRILALEEQLKELNTKYQTSERDYYKLVEKNQNIKENLTIALSEIEKKEKEENAVLNNAIEINHFEQEQANVSTKLPSLQPSVYRPLEDILEKNTNENESQANILGLN